MKLLCAFGVFLSLLIISQCRYLIKFERGVCPPDYYFRRIEDKIARCEEVRMRTNTCAQDSDCKNSGVCCDLFRCDHPTCTQAVNIPEGDCPPVHKFKTTEAHIARCKSVRNQGNKCVSDSNCQVNARCCDQYNCGVKTCTVKVYNI